MKQHERMQKRSEDKRKINYIVIHSQNYWKQKEKLFPSKCYQDLCKRFHNEFTYGVDTTKDRTTYFHIFNRIWDSPSLRTTHKRPDVILQSAATARLAKHIEKAKERHHDRSCTACSVEISLVNKCRMYHSTSLTSLEASLLLWPILRERSS